MVARKFIKEGTPQMRFIDRLDRRTVWAAVALLVVSSSLFIFEYSRGEYRYGRVVDSNNRPVADAYIQMNIYEPLWHTIDVRHVAFQIVTRSDESGHFSVRKEWRESLVDDLPFPMGGTGYTVELEACRRDLVPKRYKDEMYDSGAAVLNWQHRIRQNHDELVLRLAKREIASPYPWKGQLMWDPNIEKECRLSVSLD